MAKKRRDPQTPLPLNEASLSLEERGEVILALDDTLTRLAAVIERAAKVVELRFSGGLTEPEIGQALDVSVRTVSSEWRKARAWLTHELGTA